MEIVKVENLNFTYKGSDKKALSDISFSVSEGEFVLVCGKTGCGKTTLLRLLKREIAPRGEKSGNIIIKGKNQSDFQDKESCESVGFVFQNPEMQIVTDKVYHEIAIGLENLGYPKEYIRRKTNECASYFGFEDIFESDISKLSGGQKQLLCLASIMAMGPEILILDEPTSSIDPAFSRQFFNYIKRLSKENGTTVIVCEHRTEELFSLCDKVMFMSEGKIEVFGKPSEVLKGDIPEDFVDFLPASARIFKMLGEKDKAVPLDIATGRDYLAKKCSEKGVFKREESQIGESVFSLSDISFRYDRNSRDIIKNLSLELSKGEIFTLFGANASGKTTLLKIMSGILSPYQGKVRIFSKDIKKYKDHELYNNLLSVLPQDPVTLFRKESLIDDLRDQCSVLSYSETEANSIISEIAEKTGISHLLSRHPYDLSGGEVEIASIAKLLLSKPKILFLDEPTKGIDRQSVKKLIKVLKDLKNSGACIFIITHDVDFASYVSDRSALMFYGNITYPEPTSVFITENEFYTNSSSRISRGYVENCINPEEIVSYLKNDKI